MKIAVLMGGTSAEREVSIDSGKAVCQALETAGYEVAPVDINISERDKIIDIIGKAQAKTAFIALHGGNGEDGTIQAILESMDISYTGSGPQACELAMDKIKTRRIFEKHGIPGPDWQLYAPGIFENNGLSFPLVIKPSSQGSSIGLSIVKNKDLFSEAVEQAGRWGQDVILEEYLSGAEITVGILGEQALPVIEIRPANTFYDYQAKYEPGKTSYLVPAPLPEDIYKQAQKLGLDSHKALGCRAFSRVDMIYTGENGLKVLEVNTIPGLTATSLLPKAAKAANISFEKLCSKIIEYSLIFAHSKNA